MFILPLQRRQFIVKEKKKQGSHNPVKRKTRQWVRVQLPYGHVHVQKKGHVSHAGSSKKRIKTLKKENKEHVVFKKIIYTIIIDTSNIFVARIDKSNMDTYTLKNPSQRN